MKANARSQILFHIILGLFCAACVLPLIVIAVSSFSPSEPSLTPYVLWLKDFSLRNYAFLGEICVYRKVLRTTLLSMLQAPVAGAMTVMCAYALSREDFTGRRFFSRMFFIPIVFEAGLMPLYKTLTGLFGLSRSSWSISVPVLVNPVLIFVMRAYIRSNLPWELMEAARLDGCGELRLFTRIVLPAIRPGAVAVTAIYAAAIWNSWYHPLLMRADYGGLTYTLMKQEYNPLFMEHVYYPFFSIEPPPRPVYNLTGELAAQVLIAAVPMVLLAIVFRRRIVQLMMPALTRKDRFQ